MRLVFLSARMHCHSPGYGTPSRMPRVSYAKFFSHAGDAVIRVYDQDRSVIETHEQKGESSTYTTFGSTLTIIGERNVQ